MGEPPQAFRLVSQFGFLPTREEEGALVWEQTDTISLFDDGMGSVGVTYTPCVTCSPESEVVYPLGLWKFYAEVILGAGECRNLTADEMLSCLIGIGEARGEEGETLFISTGNWGRTFPFQLGLVREVSGGVEVDLDDLRGALQLGVEWIHIIAPDGSALEVARRRHPDVQPYGVRCVPSVHLTLAGS